MEKVEGKKAQVEAKVTAKETEANPVDAKKEAEFKARKAADSETGEIVNEG